MLKEINIQTVASIFLMIKCMNAEIKAILTYSLNEDEEKHFFNGKSQMIFLQRFIFWFQKGYDMSHLQRG